MYYKNTSCEATTSFFIPFLGALPAFCSLALRARNPLIEFPLDRISLRCAQEFPCLLKHFFPLAARKDFLGRDRSWVSNDCLLQFTPFSLVCPYLPVRRKGKKNKTRDRGQGKKKERETALKIKKRPLLFWLVITDF